LQQRIRAAVVNFEAVLEDGRADLCYRYLGGLLDGFSAEEVDRLCWNTLGFGAQRVTLGLDEGAPFRALLSHGLLSKNNLGQFLTSVITHAKGDKTRSSGVTALLKILNEAGYDLKSAKGNSGAVPLLPMVTFACDDTGLIEYLVDTVGCDVNELGTDSDSDSSTAFVAAVAQHHFKVASLLFDRGAKMVLEGRPRHELQPFGVLLMASSVYPEAVALLRRAIKRDNRLLASPLFESRIPQNPDDFISTPVFSMIRFASADLVDALLEMSDPEAATEAVNKVSRRGGAPTFPVEYAAAVQRWEHFSVLLKHKAKVTPLALEWLESRHCPRRILALAKAAAARQLEESKKEATARAAGATSNAFEGPAPKVLTEREEKKKAKKKAAKKKAKAKKRTAAKEPSAGAGKAEEGDSSSDSGDDTGEEGMDEEEKMLARAPTFDLEQERKRRAEQAAKKKGDEKKE
jgi:hypothetical protein